MAHFHTIYDPITGGNIEVPFTAEEEAELAAQFDAQRPDREKAVRQERNRRLADCDWTQLPDAPVDAALWAVYRQELRDVTAQAGFPDNVVWPAPPVGA